MASPARLNLSARRNAPFAQTFNYAADDGSPLDFTVGTARMQVRLYGAQAGSALIDLQGVGTALTEGLLLEVGSVTAFIDEATLKMLPAGKPGQPVALEYDLIIDLPVRVEEVWQQGDFTVKPGVTDRLTLLANETGGALTSDAGSYLLAG